MQPIYTIMQAYNYKPDKVNAFHTLEEALNGLDAIVIEHLQLALDSVENLFEYKKYQEEVKPVVETVMKEQSSFWYAFEHFRKEGSDYSKWLSFKIERHE